MDYEPIEGSSSSQHPTASSSTAPLHTERTLRSSTRVKASREREEKGTEDFIPDIAQQASSSSRSLRTRANTISQASSQKPLREPNLAKGKGKESVADTSSSRSTKRARRTTQLSSAPLTINEPTRDPKGKKRAAPEPASDEEAKPINKRPRTSGGYSLRSRKETIMPKKAKSTPKGKSSVKGKGAAIPGPSRSSDDKELMDVDYAGDHDHEDYDDNCQDDFEDENDDEKRPAEGDNGISPPTGASDFARAAEESISISMFSDFGRLGGYMSQLNGRLRTLLSNIKPQAEPTTRLISLQELSEILSISTEDTLTGSFQVDGFAKELVRILGGTGGQAAQDEADADDDDANGGDAAMVAALGGAGAFAGDENLEAQLLACRCLANLMEALPGCAHTLVYHGAIPVLCSKLIEISYIDLAEQTLITLEKISEEYPSAIVREGGLAALLNYLDFFSIAVQRTALQAAANCCRNASFESFPMIKDVWPIIRNCLGYADQRLVDFASLCVVRVIESYHRSHPDTLEILMDTDLVRAVNLLLLPAGGSSIVPANTFTLLIRGLATAAHASPIVAMSLLEADIVTALYQILTGVLPSSTEDGQESNGVEASQGLGGGVTDMSVMQNLAHRPKDQVEETLTLVTELMPPLPKEGIFDNKGYSEKAFHRMVKAKAKAERAAIRANNAALASGDILPSGTSSRAATPINASAAADDEGPSGGLHDHETSGDLHIPDSINLPPSTPAKSTVDRAELFKTKPQIVLRFFHLTVPILVDVFAASVSIPVRTKCLNGILKALAFQDAEQIQKTLHSVPIASFASSILSSQDHPNLVISSLQMVELLLSKDAAEYRSPFRREGVLHEIELLASRPIQHRPKERDTAKENESVSATLTMDTSESSSSAMVSASLKRTQVPDPQDACTVRARVIRFKYLSDNMEMENDSSFANLRRIVGILNTETASLEQLRVALRDLAALFASQHTSVSSFELLQSGLVDALLLFASSEKGTVNHRRRQRLLLSELFPPRSKGMTTYSPPFAVLVKKLQECLTRMETFEVFTVAPGLEDSRRSSPSLLARQLRLRLVASEDTDTPRACNNIVVSIHAIATFQALNDYLRPRLSGLLSSGGSRLSGVLAALAAGRLPSSLARGLTENAMPSTSSTATRHESVTESPVKASTSDAKPQRRRSLRLSAKASTTSLKDTKAPGPSTTPSQPRAPPLDVPDKLKDGVPAALSEALANFHDEHDDFLDADIDAEVFDEDMDHDDSMAEKTIMLSVADDGSKVEAQTPDGTRVATPNPNSSLPAQPTPSSKPSYASALKNRPSDWHLEFSMDSHVLPLDMTVYGAVHQHEVRTSNGTPVPFNLIWQNAYTIKYKKVAGPPPTSEARQVDNGDAPTRLRATLPSLTALPEDAPHSKILRLLRVLHGLNAQVHDGVLPITQPGLPETAFVNNKLTAKLTRQLEEPMIVASSCLPDWAVDLPVHFPFLFPFASRFTFLQSTSFGYARLILKWQSQQGRTQDSSRRDDSFGFLGRLQRQKVRISRKHILESAFKVFELYGSSSSILEVEYFEEVGTGLGPTLEFYSLVSKEFARRDLKIWRDSDTAYPGPYVHHPEGLFPAPLSPADISQDGGEKRTHVLRVVGQFIAKAMLDSRIIDMSINKVFLKLIVGVDVPLTISSLKLVDPELAKSLAKLQRMASEPPLQHDDDDEINPEQPAIVLPSSQKVNIEELALDFTLPGYDIELRPNGKSIPVTSKNIHEYVAEVIDAIIGKGAVKQVKAFREGFSKVFPVTDLQAFSADELSLLFGNLEEDWSIETLSEAMKADHGFNVESRSIRDLLEVLSEYDASTRREFLQFITGSPKLPIGGFRGLNPPLTVVRKPFEPPLSADDYLPSVMTCVNYLKLPEYSSKSAMREKLRIAMKEGVGSFHLS